ncbi:MAG: response regulator transcription factor [Anaerolineae bacterium]|nr:response regulator transcription factor [Anaerolineae bacterium]
MTVTIILVDDHTILRQGLRTLLESQPDFRVLAEASNGLEALDLITRLKPNVLIADIMMPEMNGLELVRKVSEVAPDTKTVILSMHAKEAYVLEAIKNGVSAYVLKDAQVDHLVRAVRDVMNGRRFLSPPLDERAIDTYFNKAKQFAADDFDMLTSREREVFQLVAEGLSSQEIAQKLSLSARTVDVHRSHIMQKLHLKTSTDLIRLAIKKGVISED